MNFEPFAALSFDCYGTLIDWETGLLATLRPQWGQRDEAIRDDEILARFAAIESRLEADHPTLLYRDLLARLYTELMRDWGIVYTDQDAERFAHSIRQWPAFADSPAALAYLKKHFELAVLSNVDRESFHHTNATLGVEFDHIITAEDVGAYKPSPLNFQRLINTLKRDGIDKSQILHVAQSLYHDIEPATRLGLHTVWVNRRADKQGLGATVAPSGNSRPSHTVTSLAVLVEQHRLSNK